MIRWGLAVALMLAATPATALAAPDLGPALARVKAQDWRGAQALLERQTRWGCPAPALYLLGLARAKTGDVRGALDAETRALGCHPELDAIYRDGAVALVRWAGTQIGATAFRFESTMSSNDTPRPGAPRGDFESHGESGEPRDLGQTLAEADRRVPGLAQEVEAARRASPCTRVMAGEAQAQDACMSIVNAPPAPPEVASP
jgi:hypothetical protein